MRKKKYTNEQFVDAVKSSTSIRQVLSKLDLSETGGNYKHFYKEVNNLNLNTDHFTGQIHKTSLPPWNKKSFTETFCKRNQRLNRRQRKYLLDKKILGELCSKCGLGNLWQNEPITLQIDHINGDPHDHNLDNLRLLCPNCHSQTETFCGKNKKANNIKNGTLPLTEKELDFKSNYKKNCLSCNKLVWRNSLRCKDCNNKLISDTYKVKL